MNSLRALYAPDFHPADRGLIPQRTCHVYWRWVVSGDPRANYLRDLGKRIIAVVPLILATLGAYLIGFVAVSIKACTPHKRELQVMDLAATRDAAKDKIADFCWTEQDTYVFHMAAIADNGYAMVFGRRLDYDGNRKALFLASPQDQRLQLVEESTEWTIRNIAAYAPVPLLDIQFSHVHAVVCAFPHEGPHPLQRINDVPMQQQLNVARGIRDRVVTLIDEGSRKALLPELVQVIASYFSWQMRSVAGPMIDDHTQGAISFGRATVTGFPQPGRVRGSFGAFAWSAIIFRDNVEKIILESDFTNNSIRAEYVQSVPGVIRLTPQQGEPYYVDLQTYDGGGSGTRFVEAYRFLRPARPLTPQQIVACGRPKPEGRPITALEFFPRLGLAKVSFTDHTISFLLFGPDDWAELPRDLHPHLEASIRREESLSWGEIMNLSPYWELLHPPQPPPAPQNDRASLVPA